MKKIKSLLSTLVVFTGLFCSCDKVSFEIIDPMVAEGKMMIHIGEAHEILVNPSGSYVWTSSDSNIASVENGYVLGKQEGQCTISVGYGKQSRSIEVIVQKTDVMYFEMPDEIEVVPGYSNSFEVTKIDPVYATARSIDWGFAYTFPWNDKFSYSITGNTVTVSCAEDTPSDAEAQLVGYGYHWEAEEFLKFIHITVKKISLSLSATSLALEEGDTRQLEATVNPDNLGGNISWSSSNPSVASCNNGLVTALKEGTATITASFNGRASKDCKVTVARKRNIPENYKIHFYSKGEDIPGYPYKKVSGQISSIDVVPGRNTPNIYIGLDDGYSLSTEELKKLNPDNFKYSVSGSGLGQTWKPIYYGSSDCVDAWTDAKICTGTLTVTAPNGSSATLTVNSKIGSVTVKDSNGIVGTTTANGGTINVKRPVKEGGGWYSPANYFVLNRGSSYDQNSSYEVVMDINGRFMVEKPAGFSWKNDSYRIFDFDPYDDLKVYTFHIKDYDTAGKEIDWVVNINLVK